MSVECKDFSINYDLLLKDLQRIILDYGIQIQCTKCETELEITTITIDKQWNGFEIKTRAYCPNCQRSQNYFKLVK